ncbi:replication-associated recombination protein A [Acanthopleuribacter pedis]|uniref:Replication-associated recombination protein A n=1 Tax=Acanthopleuribacter pedis TaxID=442870 RepID=A0A8J7QE04_9BACT|nr:replication-associated recombination protein A [Acanthopleuribacter pedis]MBO1322434.1 replication-associated recombination protein A [Acanthopleuribacter pedis]
MSLFAEQKPPPPLAERLRPKSIDDLLGQGRARHMIGAFLNQGHIPHVVFFGPPGTGKTTLSRLLARLLDWEGRSINAATAGVKDIRALAEEAKGVWQQYQRRTLVFIDEIHRLNKSQQDVLLPILEAGTFTLAGSTTENPYFALNQALRSRVQLVPLETLDLAAIKAGIQRALAFLELEAEADAVEWIATRCGGDLRLAYTTLESAAMLAKVQEKPLNQEHVALCMSRTALDGGKSGDSHYDLASAFQKSLRGSDADAAVYYLVRFIESGEDPLFVARRLLITAAEDVGNADPQALVVAGHAYRAVQVLGLPEAQIPLAQAAIYVAQAPKSNQAVAALGKAREALKKGVRAAIPKHLRDTHYAGAKEMGHGKGYTYSHNHPDTEQQFLPDELVGTRFVPPVGNRPAPTKTPVPTAPPSDPAALEALQGWLTTRQAEADWFEIDAPAVAQTLALEEAVVRRALNELVQKQELTFKRVFQVKPREKEEARPADDT